MRMRVLVRSILVGLAAMPAVGWAQQSSKGEARATDLDRVVVTATRSGEDPLQTPASITTQDMADLRLRGMDSLGDEFRGVPGVFFRRESEEYGMVNIRGITGTHGNDTFLALLDGIPMVNADEEVSLGDIPHAAVDRIEIVRGPMSTLYGRGAIAGVMNYVLSEPTEDANRFALGVGSDGFRRVEGSIERVFDSGSLLASASWDRNDGWRENSARDSRNVFVRYQHDFADVGRLSLYGSWLDRSIETGSLLPTVADGTVLEVAGGREAFLGYGAPQADVRSVVAAVRWEQRLGNAVDWTTTLTTRHYDSDSRLNFRDASGFDPDNNILAVNGFYSPNDNRIDSLETQFNWTAGRHDFVAGASHERYRVDESNYWSGQYGFTFPCSFAFYLIQVDYSTGEVVNADHPCFAHDRLQSANTARSEFTGVYLQDRITLSDRWHLTLGARYDTFDRTVDFHPTGEFNPGGRLEGSESAVSPKAALSWSYGSGLLYASYGLGFNSNFGPLFEWDPDQYAREEKPTTIESIELGWKGRVLDNRLQFETALFHMVQKNRRVVTANPDPEGPSSLSTTGRRYKSRGFEAALSWRAGEATTLAATYTWLDPEWDDFVIETGDGPLDLSGMTPAGIPSQMFSLDLIHRVSDVLSLRAVYNWNDDYQVNYVNTVEAGRVGLLNLYATITPSSLPQLSFDIGVLNALDKEYGWYFGNEFDATTYSPGAPRQFRANLRWDF